MKPVTFVFVTCLSLLVLTQHVQPYKILGIFPFAAPSHYFLGSALMRGLAEAGHDVTVVSTFGEKKPPKGPGKYRDIVLTGLREAQIEKNKNNSFFDMADKMDGIVGNLFMILMMNMMGQEISEKALEHPNIQELYTTNEHFDAVIVEQFACDAIKGFAARFKAPLILLSTVGTNGWTNPLVGNPAPPSFVPEILLNYPSKMNFGQRLKNTIFYTLNELNRNLYFFGKQNEIMKKHFPEVNHIDDVLYNVSLILLNSDIGTNDIVPKLPNMIDIGGYHIAPTKPLPKDLKDFLDSSKEGVIYFSMGSNLKSSTFPVKQRQELLNAFAKLKMKVLWKWEEPDLPGKPANVEIRDWLPQSDLLAHPNVKLFITHGGLLSTLEALHHGLPMVTIPVFADQRANAARAELDGYSVKIEYKDLSEKTLSNAINEVLTNPKYRENIQKRSKILHDKPMKPMQSAVWWTEYVIRHQGAPHLRSASLDLAWYQWILLDIVAFIVLVVAAIVSILVFTCKKLLGLCIKSKNVEKTKQH